MDVEDKKEVIKSKFSEIKYKTGCIKDTAKKFNRKPTTVRTHWFSESGFWSVPELIIDEVILSLDEEIKAQEELTQAI